MRKLLRSLALVLFAAGASHAQLTVTFVNVGQGDAVYVELPNGQNALIDGGPAGEPIVNFLRSKGVSSIDHVFLTHPHSDHFMGLNRVFTEFQVNNFYDTRADNSDAAGDDNVRRLAKAEPGCRAHYPEPGETLNWDYRVTVKVLNSCPQKVSTDNSTELNNCSIVLRFFYNGHGVLLMADAESEIENAMMRIFKSGLQSTYLKVGHHGSHNSTGERFLERVQPRVAVISAGKDNDYGHPHREVLQRLGLAGAAVYSTLDGDQTLTIPAPGRGVQLLINGEIAIPMEAPVRPFTMADHPYDSIDTKAMQQLMAEASQGK